MTDYYDPKHGAIVPLPFSVANAATNQTDTDLVVVGGTGTVYTMPAAGSIVGIGVAASAALTAGTAAFRAHKAGTEFADASYPKPELSSAAGYTNKAYASVRPGALRFAAGDRIGLSYSSSTDMAPTNTNDYDAVLFVALDPK